MRDILQLKRNLIVACGFGPTYDVEAMLEPRRGHARTLDIFVPPHLPTHTWEAFASNSLAVLTMAWSMQRSRLAIRLFKLLEEADAATGDATEAARAALVDVVKRQGRFRIGKKGSGIRVVANDREAGASYPKPAYWAWINATVKDLVRPETSLVLVPGVPMSASSAEVLSAIEALTAGAGPTLLVQQAQEGDVMMSRVL